MLIREKRKKCHFSFFSYLFGIKKPQVCGKLGALTERRGFRTRRNCLHSSHNFFRADERNCRDLKKPTKTRYRQIARFLFGIFLSGAPFAARLLMCAACAFPARALPRKSGHRRLQCFYMKRLFGCTAAHGLPRGRGRPIPPPASRWRRRCNCGPLCARRLAPAPATASCPPALAAGYRRSRSRGAGCIPLRLRRRRG